MAHQVAPAPIVMTTEPDCVMGQIAAAPGMPVAVASAGALAARTPEQELAAALANAGGEIRVKIKKEKKPAGVKYYYAYSILNAAGEEFATLKYEWQTTERTVVSVALLDGRVVWSEMVSKGSINASAGDSFGLVQAKANSSGMNAFERRATGGGPVAELVAAGQPALSIVAPSQPWIVPFMILTVCTGHFCLTPQENRIMKGTDRVGSYIAAESAVLKSNDPAILRASINIVAMLHWLDQYKQM